MSEIAYFDNNATTCMSRAVIEEMAAAGEHYGNASSLHKVGTAARGIINTARERISGSLGCSPEEVLFTSGGTESNNLAVQGFLKTTAKKHIVTSMIEHPSVYSLFCHMGENGYDVTWLEVDPAGLISPDSVRDALRKDTALVSIMYANNEIGTVQPIADIVRKVKDFSGDIAVHTDAVQALGKIDFMLDETGVDMASFSSHKLRGPMGVGALYRKDGLPFEPVFYGGHHERGFRPGTENVQGIAGFGRAAIDAKQDINDKVSKMRALKHRLMKGIEETIPDILSVGDPVFTLPNTLNICFGRVEGESIVMLLDMEGVCVSTGSACTSGTTEPSRVLLACGMEPNTAQGAIRFSLGADNTEEEVDYCIEKLGAAVRKLRKISPLGKD